MATANIGAMLRPVTSFEVGRMPIGKAATMTVAMGLGDFVKALVATVPQVGQLPGGAQLWAGLVSAWLLGNVRQVRGLVGADVAQLMQLAILADTLNDQMNISGRTADLLAGFSGGRVVSASPPVYRALQRAPQRALNAGQPVAQAVRRDAYAGVIG